MASRRRSTEIVEAAGGNFTPVAAETTRSRPISGSMPRAVPRALRADQCADGSPAGARRGAATRACPATPTSSAPSRSVSGTSARLLLDARRDAARFPRRAGRPSRAARLRARSRHNWASTAPDRRRLGFSRPSPNSIDAVSIRDFALEFLYAASRLRDPPLAPRVESSCCGRARSSASPARRRFLLGLEPDAAEEEPRRRRAAAREGAAGRASLRPPSVP